MSNAFQSLKNVFVELILILSLVVYLFLGFGNVLSIWGMGFDSKCNDEMYAILVKTDNTIIKSESGLSFVWEYGEY